jgi:hypothetical protein
MMIWSPEEELTKTCEKLRDRCEKLKVDGIVEEDVAKRKEEALEPLPPVAFGVEKDLEDHKDDVIKTEPSFAPRKPTINPKTGLVVYHEDPATAQVVTTDEDRDEYTKKDVVVLDASDDSDDEIEVIAVVGGKKSRK